MAPQSNQTARTCRGRSPPSRRLRRTSSFRPAVRNLPLQQLCRRVLQAFALGASFLRRAKAELPLAFNFKEIFGCAGLSFLLADLYINSSPLRICKYHRKTSESLLILL